MNEVKHSRLPFKITKSDHDNNGAHFHIDSRVEQYATEAEFEADRAFLELAANNHYTLTEQRDELLAALKVARNSAISAHGGTGMIYPDTFMRVLYAIDEVISKAEAKS